MRRQLGFTMIEVTVIVTVIGILALISVVSYATWRQSLADKEAKSGLLELRASMDDALNFDAVYPSTIPTSFKQTGSKLTFTIVTAADGSTYCARAQSTAVSSVVYYINPPDTPDPTTSKPATTECSTL